MNTHVGGRAVEVAGRLVGENAVGLAGERARDRHPLALAARELRWPMAEPLAEADLAQHRRRPLARLVATEAADAQRHGDVVERGEFGQQVMELVDEAEMAVAPLALLGRRRGS